MRLEIGAKDLEAGTCVLAVRHNGAKESAPLGEVGARVPALLEQIHVRPLKPSSCSPPPDHS